MSNKAKQVLGKDDIIQAVVVADNFSDDFSPITNDIPYGLLPLINRPLIDYTLEFLSLGGVDEVYIFCCFRNEAIKGFIKESIELAVEWSLTMKVNIIVSESCHSFGDCLRDLDRKGLLRGNFVLAEPGTVSNIKLLPIIKEHIETTNKDKGAAMTLILQESGSKVAVNEELLLASNTNNRLLFYRKLAKNSERKINFPLEIFMENSCVSLYQNLKDTHIAICSASVLPLFSDNFDFQTKDDFVKGLLINEEILGSTVYHHISKGSSFGGSVNNWRQYQHLSHELLNKWIYPIQPPRHSNRFLKNQVVIESSATITENCNTIAKSIIGKGCKIGKNVKISDSFIFAGTKIEDNCIISHSIIGNNCLVKQKSKVTVGSILGNEVQLPAGSFIENALVQAVQPDNCEKKDKLGPKAFRLVVDEDVDDLDGALIRKLSRLHIKDNVEETDDETDGFSDSDDEQLSYTQSPIPDDTKLFFSEVIDSLTRGFEDELQCDNLILEINSSRYAYNVTVKEVNFYVIKAILHMSLTLSTGAQYFSQFVRLLSYFAPILKNYIRNEDAMTDTLESIEDVAISNENVSNKWVMFVLKWFYDKNYISEDVILQWSQGLVQKSKFQAMVKPFTDWLEEAEEATTSEESE